MKGGVNMRKNNNNTQEFSKKFAICILITTCLVTIFACVMMYITGDISSLPVIITAIYAELATSTGFYYSKAKDENKIKLKNDIILNTLKIKTQFTGNDIEEAKELIDAAETEIENSE